MTIIVIFFSFATVARSAVSFGIKNLFARASHAQSSGTGRVDNTLVARTSIPSRRLYWLPSGVGDRRRLPDRVLASSWIIYGSSQ